jgi:adenylate cyclase
MKKLFTLFALFFGLSLCAQENKLNVDSLNQVWSDVSLPDSARFKAMEAIIWEGYLFTKPDTAFILLEKFKEVAKQKGNKQWEARALNMQGVYFVILGNFSLALEYDVKGLKIYEQIGHKEGIANSFNDIGVIYKNLDQPSKALDYFTRALEMRIEIKVKDHIPSSYNNIGVIHSILGNELEAIKFFIKSIEEAEEIGDKEEMINPLYNVAEEYYLLGDTIKALAFISRSIKLSEEINHNDGVISAFYFLARLHFDQKHFSKALEYSTKSLDRAVKIGYKRGVENAAGILSKIYKFQGFGIKALEMYELEVQMRDSIKSDEAKKGLIKMEVEHEFEKKELIAEEAHQKEIYEKNQTRNYLAGGGLFALLLAGGIFSRLNYVRKAKNVVEKEKDRSNNLLLNILPADVAEELKIHGKAEARAFDLASIIFTDFKGFTHASSTLSAQELVAKINICFEAFDHISEKYQIEKIKTIGDAYMAAGGLPVPSDESVKNTVFAALEMQAFITNLQLEKEAKGEHAFQMRVGIHTGPVVAGIVGVKKFQYDIWGDTVNTASRMESAGEVGKVNISQATYELVKEEPQFTFESRGKIEVKGKGEMEMYFVSQK